MIERTVLTDYLTEYLDADRFEDYGFNGLQVEGKENVSKIITGVSASERLFREAIKQKAEAIIVHHGLFWKSTPHPFFLTGIMKQRIKLLLEHDINLYGYHLPLDSHTQSGNNIVIANQIGIEDPDFVFVQGKQNLMAVVGDLPYPMKVKDFAAWADKRIETRGQLLDFGKKEIQSLYILSGGGGNYYQDAVDHKVDIMITGELSEQSVRAAEENKLALYAAGHYNSEKWGVRALGQHLGDKFKLNTQFIDIPNPI